jgi:nucleotidyltransferase substrate binding protein (TIGR01987 family)
MNEETARWMQRLNNYHKALNRLAEIVNESKKRKLNEFERDCVIQRFEFTHETAWKLMKSYAEYQGYDDIGGSRDATRRAYDMRLIEDGITWMEMIKSRNETSHNYDGSVADAVITRITDSYYPLMLSYYEKMNSLSEKTENDIFVK